MYFTQWKHILLICLLTEAPIRCIPLYEADTIEGKFCTSSSNIPRYNWKYTWEQWASRTNFSFHKGFFQPSKSPTHSKEACLPSHSCLSEGATTLGPPRAARAIHSGGRPCKHWPEGLPSYELFFKGKETRLQVLSKLRTSEDAWEV